MPHQCVKCGHLYGEAGNEVVKGCVCGNRMFFFIRKEKMPGLSPQLENLSDEQKTQIEEDVLEILGEGYREDLPVILDLETIHVTEPGKYEIDLVNLFKKKNPLIVKLDEGRYVIDIAETFRKFTEK